MKTWRPLLAVGVLVIAAALLTLLTRRTHRQQAAPPAATAAPNAAAVALPTPVPAKLVLFFPGDDTLLHRETRDVAELPAGGPSRVRVVMEELLAGSQQGFAPVFPWAATLETVFVDQQGDAYVDLSPPPPDTIEGTTTEMTIAYATTNTVAANCPGIAKVQLLFGGREVDTFGHLDLSRPLAPRPELVAP
jgi:hypothetical protein